MQGETGLIIEATRKAAKFLYRDYFELENLQSSVAGNEKFCASSAGKSFELLKTDLSKYYKNILTAFDHPPAFDHLFLTKLPENTLIIEPLDAPDNFAHALPFFAIAITRVIYRNDKLSADKYILNFPALNEIYYAERGGGAWIENYSSMSSPVRIRVSKRTKLVTSLFAVDDQDIKLQKNNIGRNWRSFGSSAYSAALLSRGKVDIYITTENSISYPGRQLLITESGGRSLIHENTLIGTNSHLFEEIKSLYLAK